ncbi:hypothetical protein [Polaromonas sp.]|uniref:hypothetical protein n=1 Tax=Polaromonas sp. TaxID=1869339 RepID=UPI003753C013
MQSTLDWPQGVTLPADKRESPAEPGTSMSRASTQRASVAQLLLVARLKARNRRDLAVDTLERGAHVMWVTCKSWFSSGGAAKDSDSNKDTDAHRDR